MASNFVNLETKTSNPQFEDVFDIAPTEVLEKKGELVLIDVRQPDEYTGELGHAPGASLLVLNTLPEKIDSLPKDKTIVFLCRSGGRSAQATAFAKSHGFSEVYNMKGGMLLWNDLLLPVER